MDEDPSQLVNQLGGFALDAFLSEFTGDRSIRASGLHAVTGAGGGSSVARNGVDASQIYNDRLFEDGTDGEGEGDDFEDEVDRELNAEDAAAAARSTASAMPPLPPSLALPKTRMRGEDDNFDDDDEDEDGDEADRASATRQGDVQLSGLFLPQAGESSLLGGFNAFPPLPMQIKQEELADERMHEDNEDPAEVAAQQALFQQSYARMQVAQQQLQPDDGYVGYIREPSPPAIDTATLYPSFAPHKVLNFTELFVPRPRKRARIDPTTELHPLPQASHYSNAPSTRDFRSHHTFERTSAIAQYLLESLREQAEGESEEDVEDDQAVFEDLVRTANGAGWRLPVNPADEKDTISFDDWQEGIVWDADSRMLEDGKEDGVRQFSFRNPDAESGDWMNSVVWDARLPFKDFTKLQLNLNDPAGPAALPRKQPAAAEFVKKITLQSTAGTINDPYNMSNDKLYEVRREQKKTVRQTFGQLEVQHTYPAMKLQFPWYKTQLSKMELRSFHRLPIQFPANIPLSFSKVRSAKKKKDKTGRKLKKDSMGAEAFRTMADLSLRDTGTFVLFEYVEEHPMIISNVGMGNILVNYYRKTDPADSYVPKAEMGEPFLLDPSDESPFMRFGQVEPGQMVPALYNNLIRAPVFKHQAYDTDFLVVKTTVLGETKFYLREIKHAYVVGQTYPLKDVPGPQSRKLTATAKHRLQSIAYKLVSKNAKRRVKIGKLLKYFPDQTEMQMRQRLKEFMEYNRAGDDQGFWKIKQGKMPDEDELFKLIGPEQIVLAESTQVGQRNLLDAGLSSTVDEDTGKDNEESTLDVRQQLAPWFTSKNFLNAAQNKAMLKLHGEGDPSNRGEGFSFLRVSMKDIFLRAGEKMEDRLAEIEARPKSAHRYNVAEQQAIYKTEIDRIWRAQYEALSSPYEPQISEADELRWRLEETKMEGAEAMANAATPFTPADAGSPVFGRSASPGADGLPKGPPKVMRIKRLINGVWRSEIVRDQNVIKGYIRQRNELDAEEVEEPENLVLTGDPEKDAIVKKKLAEQLEKLRKNQERRLQRKNAKMGVAGDVFLPGGKKIKNETTRRCGNCGQIGHMKTNRKCPKWAEFNAANNQLPGANSNADLSNPFAVGLPGLTQTGSPTD